jgi:signal transduction histidine kinase
VALRHSAQLLANLPISRALMTTAHAATIQDASTDLWTTAGTDLLVLADRGGEVMGVHSSTPALDRRIAQDFMRRSLTQEQTEYWWMAGNHLYEVSIQPIYLGPAAENRVLGFVALGYEIDDGATRELSQVAASQVAFWYGGNLVRSTLSAADQEDYVRLRASGRLGTKANPFEIQLGSDRFVATAVDLAPGTKPEVRLAVLKSLAQSNAFIAELNRLLLGLGLIAVLAGSAVVFVVSRTFTKPLEDLVAGVRALGRGEFSYPLAAHQEGEVAELTTAFLGMRASLQESQRELLDAERLATIGRMASSISHDLRHQLAAILANAEFLSEQRSQHERTELYDELRAAVAQMTDLIDSLLEFSRPRESLRLSWTRLDDMLERAVQTVRARPEFRNVSVAASSSGLEGWFDSNKLQRVFQNLIINGCEASGTENGSVKVSSRRQGQMVEITVEDNGRGIADHLHDSIFEPFVSHGKENGTGLGLTVVHKIVQDHGGEVRVRTTSSAGTAMVVSLPLLSSPHAVVRPGVTAAVAGLESSD